MVKDFKMGKARVSGTYIRATIAEARICVLTHSLLTAIICLQFRTLSTPDRMKQHTGFWNINNSFQDLAAILAHIFKKTPGWGRRDDRKL